ncbi:MAG TPA: glycoside hydrolase family 71/99-like protein [Pedobacter sp.]
MTLSINKLTTTLLLYLLPAALYSQHFSTYTPDPSTLNKKVMFGYQGWQATPADGSGAGVWRHWFGRSTPDSAHAGFDLWPDMREYPAAALEATNMLYPDGSKAKLYSAYKYETVDVHFKWMKEQNLDGVFEQRFISDISGTDGRKHFNQVVRNVKQASEKYKRVYCIMYDISGAGPDWKEKLVADWKFLVDSLGVTKGSSYLHHKGRPLVTIWGMGFAHTAFATAEQSAALLDWFHSGAEKKYQATVMGGVNDNWLSHQEDWKAVYNKMDVISPWAVGRYGDDAGADKFKAKAIVPDKAYCDQKTIDYMPVIFPGVSWNNMHHGKTPFNQIKRRGGDFYWRQSYNAVSAGVNMVYIGMYDEVDEGTAMYKVAPSKAGKPVHANFISLDIDGYDLPADWYLRLANATAEILRGKAPNTADIPAALLRTRKMLKSN